MDVQTRWSIVNAHIAQLGISDEVASMIDSIEKPNHTKLSNQSGAIASMIVAARKKGMQPKYYIGADQFSDSIDIFSVIFDDHLSFDESYEKAFRLKTAQAAMRVISLDAWEYILGI